MPAQLGQLEQVLLGAGGEGLRLALVVVVDERSSSSSFMAATTFSASLFMLR
jgi:hypothetical protein